jgi:mevalonate kinase
MKMVTASAPGKLMLFGEHAVVHGFPCIVTAVDQRLYVTVKKNGVDMFHLEAPDLGLSAYTKRIEDLGRKDLPKAVRFVEMLYKRFLENHPQDRGIVVTTKSDFLSTFGFGSSSAVTVAFAKALTKLYGVELSKKELFDLCYRVVIDVQGVGSGFDLAAAIWGGTLYYVSPAKVVEKMKIDDLPLIVGYTGIKADTPTIVRIVGGKLERNRYEIMKLFEDVEEVVEEAKKSINKQDWKKVGRLMNRNQAMLQKLEVSSEELDRLNRVVVEGGALGAKLSGAGGGDCMVAVVEKNDRVEVENSIDKAGGEVMKVKLNASGVRIENE